MSYKRRVPSKLSGNELFQNSGEKNFTVLQFWQYAYSNLSSNILRGALAEFLVEVALSEDGNVGLRNPWSDYDIKTQKGNRVEVKCCAYLQDWDQSKLSTIKFSGLRARDLYWSDAVSSTDTNPEKGYKSDIYVFAVHTHQVPETMNMLDLEQWSFYVLSKEDVARISNNGNSISLVRLHKNGFKSVSFAEIKNSIQQLGG